MQRTDINVPLKKRRKKQNDFVKYMIKNRWLYLFMAPAFILVLIFNYVPLWGLIMAFQDFNPMRGIHGSSFVGLVNFKSVFENYDFPRIMKNTLGISSLGFIFGFPLPIMFAIMINELRNLKFKKFVQTASYLPHFISWVVVSGIMYNFLDINGIINDILAFLGLQTIQFFGEPKLFWPLSVGIAIWKELGWSTIIYLAAIAGIDQGLYEAAVVDGATRFQRIINITLPGIRTTVALMLILSAGNIFSGAGISPGFDGVFNLTNGVIGEFSDTLDIWIYKEGIMRANYSFATAMGLMLSVVNFILVYLANRMANKINDSGIL